ncbi:MAG: ComF family protein [Kiritimatiellia bacterium]
MIFPRFCVGCGGSIGSAPDYLCWDCRARLDLIGPPFCSICGDPAEGSVGVEYVCSLCRRQHIFFDRARSVARYEGPLRRAIQAFKYAGAIFLRRDFVDMLAACVQTQYRGVRFDAVLAVPLYRRRERERTYNQAGLLARGLARVLELPHLSRFVQRIKATATQTHLDASRRRKNVAGAFCATDAGWLEGRTLLLVDDVMTTGATVNECARSLREAGAAGIYVVTIARG